MSTKKLQIVSRIVATDETLTQSGLAADAKIVGEAITNLNTLVGEEPVAEQLSTAIAAIPQSDWGQNDETQPDYVKNRTHYDAGKSEQRGFSVEGSDAWMWYYDCWAITNNPTNEGLPFVGDDVNATYEAEIDGIRYTNPTIEIFENCVDLTFTDADNDFEYVETTTPYVLKVRWWGDNEEFAVFTALYNCPNSVAFYKVVNEIHQLDEKYIPDTIARTADLVQSDFEETDETSLAFIKNKPDENDAIALVAEFGLIDPVTSEDGAIYTDIDGKILSL